MRLEELLAEAKRISELRCSDGYCKFGGKAKGQHTNGGCRCQADPNYSNRGPYADLQYMANLLGLIAIEFEQNKKMEDYMAASQEIS